MKKILSIALTLVMILTMATVPATAANDEELAKLTLVSAYSPWSENTGDKAVDNDETTFYATSGYIDPPGRDASRSYNVIFDIGEIKTLTELELYWSGSGWGYVPANKYKVHVSSDNVTYTEILSYSGIIDSAPNYGENVTYTGDTTGASFKARVIEDELFIRDVRYIKIEIIGWKYRAALAEVKATVRPADAAAPVEYTVSYVDENGNSLHSAQTIGGHYVGDEVTELAPNIEGYVTSTPSKTLTLIEGTNKIVFVYAKTSTSRGGQIRLPSNSYSAGLRFGVTINKAVFGTDAIGVDYDYAAVAEKGITVGMFLLPVDLLGGSATLADYMMSGGTKAYNIPAKKVYSEDEKTVTFTAVLTNIPKTDYNREVVAVPYICVGGGYTFFDEMRKSYAGVAEGVATSYQNGKVTLTATQKTLLEEILGRTLTK